jgi:hypothetical protein
MRALGKVCFTDETVSRDGETPSRPKSRDFSEFARLNASVPEDPADRRWHTAC